MRVIIDWSLYNKNKKCIYYEIDYNKNRIFTYKTNNEINNNINKELSKFIKKLEKNKNINKFYLKKNISHKDIKHRELICDILEEFGNDKEWIWQKIYENNIYQVEVWKQTRMFFICEEKIDKIIINPLFLDLNHVIFYNNNFTKEYNICWICNEKKCS